MKINVPIMNTIFKYLSISFLAVLAPLLVTPYESAQAAVRVKDIAYIQGVRDNQIYGYGLVVCFKELATARYSK